MFGSAWISNPCHRGIILSNPSSLQLHLFLQNLLIYINKISYLLYHLYRLRICHYLSKEMSDINVESGAWYALLDYLLLFSYDYELVCFCMTNWDNMYADFRVICLPMLMQFWIKSYIYPTSIYLYQLIFFFATNNSFWCLSLRLQLGYFLCSEVSTSGAITKFNRCQW